MDPQATGLPGDASQAQAGNSQATGQAENTAQQPNAATQPDATSAQSTTKDNSSEIQAQLAQMQVELRKAQESARYFQSEKDRAAAQLQALVGAQPQQDPLASDVQRFVKAGYDEKDARFMAEFVSSKLTPLQQENQRLQASLQGTAQVNTAMQAVYERDPQLFADPSIGQTVHQYAMQSALSGQPVDPEYIHQLAMIEWANKNRPWAKGATPQTPQPQVRPMQPMGFMGQANGYTPVLPQQPNQKPESVRLAEQEIAKHFNFQP